MEIPFYDFAKRLKKTKHAQNNRSKYPAHYFRNQIFILTLYAATVYVKHTKMKRSNANLTERKKVRLLCTYRKAWAREHAILQQMLIHGTSPAQLCDEYGISAEDISNMYQRMLTVALPWVEEYRQSGTENSRTKPNRHTISYTSENIVQRATPPILADSKREELLKLKLDDCGVQLRYRVLKTLHSLEIYTIKDLSETPLFDLLKYRGFGPWCMRELLSFIESSQLDPYFEGFKEAKKMYGRRL